MQPSTSLQWHAIPLAQVLETLKSTTGGLTHAEAQVRQEYYGANRLPQSPPPSIRHIWGQQFCSSLIYILGLAAVVSVLIGDRKDAAFIALAVSAIPEGLPVALTVALAIATHRMAKRGVIVRRSPRRPKG